MTSTVSIYFQIIRQIICISSILEFCNNSGLFVIKGIRLQWISYFKQRFCTYAFYNVYNIGIVSDVINTIHIIAVTRINIVYNFRFILIPDNFIIDIISIYQTESYLNRFIYLAIFAVSVF